MKTFVTPLKPLKFEYEQFLKIFKANDWLRGVYNVVEVMPFVEAFKKTVEQYYPNKICNTHPRYINYVHTEQVFRERQES